MLVVYYSWSFGNTKKIAETVAKTCGADLACIETVKEYQGSYDEVVSQGQREVEEEFLPEIKHMEKNIADYDVIAIGTPTWWYTMAPAVHTFLHENDFEGKTVIPFMTNAGWPGTVINDMKKECNAKNILMEQEFVFSSKEEQRTQMVTENIVLEKWIQKISEYLQ